jgi:hypothetical protein
MQMPLNKLHPRAWFAAVAILASLALVSGWTEAAWAQSPGGVVLDPGDKGAGGEPDQGDPDMPDPDQPPPTSATWGTGSTSVGSGSTHTHVERGTIPGHVPARRMAWWDHWAVAAKFWLRYAVYR